MLVIIHGIGYPVYFALGALGHMHPLLVLCLRESIKVLIDGYVEV